MKIFRRALFFVIVIMLAFSTAAVNPPVAYASSQAWETVGSDVIAGINVYMLRLALDSHDTPYVAYVDTSQNGALLKYNGTSWETLGNGAFAPYINNDALDLVIDSQDNPYVTYIGSGKPVVKKYTDSGWDTLNMSGTSGARYIALAFDSQDTPYIAYKNTSAYGQTLTVQKYNGTSWENAGDQNFPGQAVDNMRLAFDSHDVLYVVYESYSDPISVHVKKLDGSAWVDVGGYVGVPNPTRYGINLKLDSNDCPYVSFTEGGNGFVYKFNGTDWQQCTGSMNNVADFNFALDSQNTPYVVYRNFKNQGYMAEYDTVNNAWKTGMISTNGMEKNWIVFDSLDQPFVLCKDWANSDHPRLYVFRTYYTVDYAADANGSISGTSVQAVVKGGDGEEVTAQPNPHYHFKEWSDGIDSAVRKEEDVLSDLSLTASFEIDSHTVTFDAQDGGDPYYEETKTYGSSLTAPSDPEKEGYTFQGWYPEKECKTEAVDLTGYTFTENITFYAKWKINNYTVSFDPKNGNAPSVIKADYNTAIYAPSEPKRLSYTFKGWSLDSIEDSDTVNISFPYTVKNNITLYAIWQGNTYTVSFDTQGGNKLGNITVRLNGEYGNLPVPKKSGYSFCGWYTQANGKGQEITRDTIVYITANQTLYANWFPNMNQVRANANNAAYGTISGTGKYATDKPVTLMAKPNNGYYFINWTENGNKVSTNYAFAFTVKGPRTLQANFGVIGKTSLTAVSSGYNSIKLSWKSVPGASGYEIYRSTSSNSGYSLFAKTTGLSYSNPGLSTGTTYYYKIKVYSTAGSYVTRGADSSVQSAKPILAAVSGFKCVKASSTSAKLNWTAVSGRTKYEIYRKTGSGKYSLIASTTSTAYGNKGLSKGKKYTYKVVAYRTVNGKKIYGKYSPEISVKL